jgi:hypothetical protein
MKQLVVTVPLHALSRPRLRGPQCDMHALPSHARMRAGLLSVHTYCMLLQDQSLHMHISSTPPSQSLINIHRSTMLAHIFHVRVQQLHDLAEKKGP